MTVLPEGGLRKSARQRKLIDIGGQFGEQMDSSLTGPLRALRKQLGSLSAATQKNEKVVQEVSFHLDSFNSDLQSLDASLKKVRFHIWEKPLSLSQLNSPV